MKKILLLILDGVGYSKETKHNAVLLADAPYLHSLMAEKSFSLLRTDGRFVGLPEGVMGNSEVGHISIGSGRIVYQDLTKITKFSTTEGFTKKKRLHDICGDNTIHIMGLLSDGGVHSHIDHLYALLDFYNQEYPKQRLALHIITDGRDTAPKSGLSFVKKLEKYISDKPQIKVVSLSGRYYAMDRDKRWDRLQKSYDNMFKETVDFATAASALEASYAKDINDEFVLPCKISSITPQKKDAFIFFNFRSDRAREISQALAAKDFNEFPRKLVIDENRFFCFTAYSEDFSFPVLFPKESPQQTLGEVMQNIGLKQLRIAETEKYAHVTYFFNGGNEEVFKGEDRILVPSPKEVATYDLKPEMSAPEVTARLVEQIKTAKYDLIVCNYANGDMVGHTGIEAAAIKAMEVLDESLFQVIPTALEKGYSVFVTADHGNCEQMLDENSGEAFTQHSMNPVPFIYIGSAHKKLKDGALQDIAPTILAEMGLEQPKEMTGTSLFE